MRDTHHRKTPSILIGDLLPLLVPSRRTPMTSLNLNLRHGIHARTLQSGQPFHRLHIQHTSVIHRRGNENLGKNRNPRIICIRRRILIRRIFLHIPVHVRIMQRIAPLIPLRNRQRQRRIKNRRQRIHKRHIRLNARDNIREPYSPRHPSTGHRRNRHRPPCAAGDAKPARCNARTASTKSSNECFLLSKCPCSYQARPISPPPRMCGTA